MSIQALNIALSGLRAAQAGLDVVARNASNVSTPGYTRKTLPQESIIVNGQALGVQNMTLRRSVNEALLKEYMQQNTAAAGLDVTNDYLNKVQTLHGTPDQQISVSSQISKLQDVFRTLSATPESAVVQSEVVRNAQSVAASFNKLSTSYTSMRNDAQDQLRDSVTTVNQKLSELASLNRSVVQTSSYGQSTADLEDQRDQVLRDLSAEIDVTYYKDNNNVIVVQTKDGSRLLADTQAKQLSFTPTTLDVNSAHPASAAGVFIDSYDLANGAPGGHMGALIELRDSTLPKYQAQLDELAQKMAMRFDAQGLRLFTDTTGAVPPDVVASYVGFSAQMQVNSAVVADPSLVQQGTPPSGAPPASNDLINKIMDFTFGTLQDNTPTPNTPFRTTGLGPGGNIDSGMMATGTLEDFSRRMIAFQADEAADAKSGADFQGNYRDLVQKTMQDQSGVNLDEEMANMLVFQKSYAASARIITTASTMFDELMQAF